MTLKDVAKVSGCSVATVSKVFKNSAEISIETKERVIKAAESVGYLKKATSRPAVLGGQKPVVFSDPKGKYANIINSVKNSAEKQGLTLLYVMLEEKYALELVCQIGAWGLVMSDKLKNESENAVSFFGDMKELSENFEKFAGFVPKRASRSKSATVKNTANREKNKKAQESKQNRDKEEIWLL